MQSKLKKRHTDINTILLKKLKLKQLAHGKKTGTNCYFPVHSHYDNIVFIMIL